MKGWSAIRAGNKAIFIDVARAPRPCWQAHGRGAHATKEPSPLPSPGVPGEGEKPLRRDHLVRVDDEFLGRALVEILVALGGFVEGNDRRVDGLGDLYLVMQDGHHQIAVVALDGALAGDE